MVELEIQGAEKMKPEKKSNHSRRPRKILAAAAMLAGAAGFFISRSASAAPVLIENDESAVVSGWSITAPSGVSLQISVVGSQLDIAKSAMFTSPNQSFQVGLFPVAGATNPATSIDFTSEMILNDTGAPFGEFDFILQNDGSKDAIFSGDVFLNAIGPTAGSLDTAKDFLSYLGTQANGTTSSWGGTAGNDLFISIPTGAIFTLDEASVAGSNSPNSGSTLPEPASLGLLGAFGLGLLRRRQPV
jgi:MYXO-CTERM domain-containing protein